MTNTKQTKLNIEQANSYIENTWESSIIPQLVDYIAIPNKSPAFDVNWQANGYMDKAVQLMVDWVNTQAISGLKIEVVKEKDLTPLIYIEVPGQIDNTILMYGHLDKQPEMTGWEADLGPWKPVRKGDLLYGRGGADDGYAIFASLTAIKTLQEQNIPHSRCVIIIEASEESGSIDLVAYVEKLQSRIGEPELVICLDSGAGNYEQMWSTTSLRGLVNGVLTVDIISEGLHSGVASGVVPDSFRILRELISRVEDEKTGEILLPELQADIPKQRIEQAEFSAQLLKDEFQSAFPFVGDAKPVADNTVDLILNRTWRPALSIIGIEGIPNIDNAGNVLRPRTSAKLSMRLAPTTDAKFAYQALKKAFETNPPYNAKVTFKLEDHASGWNAPLLADWLQETAEEASIAFFNKSTVYFGEGGSIPFMGMLGEKFPNAQFLITGVLGPKSNAHGPNEFLHLAFAKKLTGSVAYVIAKHCQLRSA